MLIHMPSDSHLLRKPWPTWKRVAPHHFIQLRKSAIVNSAPISQIRPMFDGDLRHRAGIEDAVTSSRRYAHKLRALLES